MSTVMNEGFKISCKAVMTQLFTVLGILVELSKTIAKPKGYLEASPSIRQPYITVTSNSPVIYSSLFSYFFFSSILWTNIRYLQSRVLRWIHFESEVIKSADLCGTRYITGKINGTVSRNCLYIIDLIKERIYIFWSPGVICKKDYWSNQEKVL